MILAYLIVSVFLSFVGALFFKWFVEGRVPAHQEKWMIYLVIGVSLIAPVSGFYVIQETGWIHSSYLGSAIANNHDCSDEDILEECMLIEADGEFCDCEVIKAQNIVAYKANQFYEFADQTKAKFLAAVWIFGIFMAGLLIIRIFYLVSLVKRSSKESIEIEGTRVILLTPERPHALGSFKIANNYIIWNNRLDHLSQSEREAILLHELSHIRQKNTWELMVLTVVQVFWFLNPLFYYFKHQLIRISEVIADEFAVKRTLGKKWYANLLLQLHERSSSTVINPFSGSHVPHRINHLMRQSPVNHRSFAALIASFLLIMTLSTYVSISVMASEQHMMDVYHTLKQKSQETGRDLFCKDCLHLEEY